MSGNKRDSSAIDLEVIFQQDGASAHTAMVTQDWLESQGFRFIGKEEWPAKSPDVNVLENFWAIMQAGVNNKEPKTSLGLQRVVKKMWREVKEEWLHRLVDSMNERVQKVIDRNGDFLTEY